MEKAVKEEDKHLHTAIFTMVIALIMLCIQRAVVVSLVERWRARIFLLLNIVLLAVLFTSFHFSTRSSDNEHERDNKEEKDEEEEKRGERIATKRKHLDVVTNTSSGGGGGGVGSTTYSGEKCEFARKKTSSNNVINRKVEEDLELSEEELNRRVEAFITMFRQQLVSDSKRRSRLVLASKTRASTKQRII